MSSDTICAVIRLNNEMHQLLRRRAAETHRSISEIVTDAVREAFRKEEREFAAIGQREHDKPTTYQTYLKKLKAKGAL